MAIRTLLIVAGVLFASPASAQFASLEQGQQLSRETGRPVFVMAGRKT